MNTNQTQTAQFTPGPWRYRSSQERHELAGYITGSCGNSETRYAVALPHGLTGDEAEANARLIAAAPAMFEALQAVDMAWTGDGIDMATAVDKCLQALALANGKDSK